MTPVGLRGRGLVQNGVDMSRKALSAEETKRTPSGQESNESHERQLAQEGAGWSRTVPIGPERQAPGQQEGPEYEVGVE